MSSPLLVCVGDLMVDVAVEAPALALGGRHMAGERWRQAIVRAMT